MDNYVIPFPDDASITPSASDTTPASVSDLTFPGPEKPADTLTELVVQYRLANGRKKAVEAELEALKPKLRTLLESNGNYKDTYGFAMIVAASPPAPYISGENTAILHTLATNLSASDNFAVAQAGRTILVAIEMKTRAAYVLIK